jgi:hypothetical protein
LKLAGKYVISGDAGFGSWNMIEVSSTEFVKRFAEYRRKAQQEPVAVTHHGRATEYLLSREAFEDYQRLKQRDPKAYWSWELPREWVDALEADALAAPAPASMD